MSRLGKKPITLPKGVELKISKDQIEVKGPKGTVMRHFPKGISARLEEGKAFVEYSEGMGLEKPMHGLYRALLNNAVLGVSEGFQKQLSLVGVGYRAAVKGQVLDLQLGFSHPSQVDIPSDLKVAVEKNTLITISGVDKQLVGQFAATVRRLRPPEPYKGKGIRYVNEHVRKKAGKAAKGK